MSSYELNDFADLPPGVKRRYAFDAEADPLLLKHQAYLAEGDAGKAGEYLSAYLAKKAEIRARYPAAPGEPESAPAIQPGLDRLAALLALPDIAAASTILATRAVNRDTSKMADTDVIAIGSAPAAGAIADHLKPFFAAGLGLIVLGALSYAFGGKGSAGALVAMGAFTVWTGTSIIQYPWITLLAPVAIAAILVFIVRDMWRAKQATAVVVGAVEAAENKKEITEAIKEKGPEVVQLVRSLVDPIKVLLAKGESGTIAGKAG